MRAVLGRGAAVVLWILAIFGLGQAIHARNGSFSAISIALLTLSIIAIIAVAVSESVPSGPLHKWVRWLLRAALLVQFLELFLGPITMCSEPSARTLVRLCLVVAALAALAASTNTKRAAAILLGLYAVLGVVALRGSPNPPIDVIVMHRDSITALLRGINPYTITFPNVYVGGSFYGPGMVESGRVMFGYPYPPLSLLFAIPGQLIFSDYRYSYLVAMIATGAIIAASTPGEIGVLGMAILLFSPRSFFVLEQGWSDPVVLFLAVLCVSLARRQSRWLPFALGALWSSKQYALFTIPAIFVLRDLYPTWQERALSLAKAAAVALVINLPFIAWDWRAIYRDLVTIHANMPFRDDSLSFPVLWHRALQSSPPALIFNWLAALVAFFIVWRAPRTAAGFALAIASGLVLFFAASKGFCNYYYLVVGVLACGMVQPATALATVSVQNVRNFSGG